MSHLRNWRNWISESIYGQPGTVRLLASKQRAIATAKVFPSRPRPVRALMLPTQVQCVSYARKRET